MEPATLARLRRTTVVVLALALLATLPGPASAQSAEERRLEANRAKVAEVRDRIEAAEADASTDQAVLADAQAEVNTVLDAVNAAALAVQRQHEAVEEAREELAELEAEVAEQERLMTNRAVAIYRQGGGAPFGELLTASSPEDALRRSAYMDLVNRNDQASFEGVSVARTAVDAQREVLQAEEAVLARVLEEEQLLLADAEAIRDSRAVEAAASADQLEDLQAEERHLEEESREIAALARRNAEAAEASRSAAAAQVQSAPSAEGDAEVESAPVASGGGWTWPASGPVTSGYGRRWGRAHEGIDIGAPSGAPIWAARSGVVTYAGRMGGYGNLVLIDHGGGIVTAYAHQSRIMVSSGSLVGAGERIGSVGSTGNSTGPHLHFEVRVNGAPRNPLAYLG